MPQESAPEISPCPLFRVVILLPLVKGLVNSSQGFGVSLLRARKATREEVPSPCNTYHRQTDNPFHDKKLLYAHI